MKAHGNSRIWTASSIN